MHGGVLSGVVQSGRGLGAGLMADATVMVRLRELAGFPIVPGTLNVRLPAPLERDSRLSTGQVELFSEAHLRTALGLADGDPIVVRVQ